MGYGNAITIPVNHVAQLQTNAGKREVIGSPNHRMRSHAINICVNKAACNGISCTEQCKRNWWNEANTLNQSTVVCCGIDARVFVHDSCEKNKFSSAWMHKSIVSHLNQMKIYDTWVWHPDTHTFARTPITIEYINNSESHKWESNPAIESWNHESNTLECASVIETKCVPWIFDLVEFRDLDYSSILIPILNALSHSLAHWEMCWRDKR